MIMISIYCFASINNLPGTFKNPKIGLINTVPIKIKIAETITPNTSAIANDLRTLFLSPAPNFCAVMIANPLARPNKKVSSTLQLPCPSFLRGGFLFLSFSFIIES